MKIEAIKFYEGNNIKRKSHIIKITLNDSTRAQIEEITQLYIDISKMLELQERVIEINDEGSEFIVWVSYSQEEVSRCIWMQLIYGCLSNKIIFEKAKLLLEESSLFELEKLAEDFDIPVIKISKGFYQFGYGKSSVVLSNSYQSYEDMSTVLSSLNRLWVLNQLNYNDISTSYGKVIYDSEEIKNEVLTFPITLCSVNKHELKKIVCEDETSVKVEMESSLSKEGEVFLYRGKENYRVICIEGIIKTFFLLGEKVNGSDELIIKRLENIVKNVYQCIPIKFMYIDLLVDSDLRVVDVGCIFNIVKELNKSDLKETSMLLLHYLKDKDVGAIPIYAVTGTNGKTTIARLLNNLLIKLGFYTGLACTGYIAIGNEVCEKGDTTGFLSSRKILLNNKIEAAVFETARGGILRNGLGFEKANASIITSISEDHIGIDGIRNLQDLVNIKTVILDVVKSSGKYVIKAQKEVVDAARLSFNKMADICQYYKSFEEMVCLFALNKNILIQSHVDKNGEAYYLKNNYIVHNINGKEKVLVDVTKLEFTHFGISKGNILNVMAALAALTTLPLEIDVILEMLKEIRCDIKQNPGRQNIIKYKDFNILVDYGHNAEAYNEVYSIVKALKPTHVTSILSAPGDRMDSYIEELGNIAGKTSDFIILREHKNQRGSKNGRVSGLMKKGAIKVGMKDDDFTFILNDVEALSYAVKKAVKNEMIIFFTEEPEIFIEKISLKFNIDV